MPEQMGSVKLRETFGLVYQLAIAYFGWSGSDRILVVVITLDLTTASASKQNYCSCYLVSSFIQQCRIAQIGILVYTVNEI